MFCDAATSGEDQCLMPTIPTTNTAREKAREVETGTEM